MKISGQISSGRWLRLDCGRISTCYLLFAHGSSPPGEKILEKGRCFGSGNAVIDFGSVMAGGMGENARTMEHAAAFGVVGAKVKSANAGVCDGASTHGARLKRHVEIAIDQALAFEDKRCSADREYLRVGRWIRHFARAVTSLRENFALGIDNDGADGYFAPHGCSARFVERDLHRPKCVWFWWRQSHLGVSRDIRIGTTMRNDRTKGKGPPPRKAGGKASANFPEGRGGLIPAKDAERMIAAKAQKDANKIALLKRLKRDRREALDAGEVYQPQKAGAPLETMRIAKAMARAGLCSRRDAERWIEDGRVVVNGKRISSPALDVGPRDKIVVDGRPLPQAEPPRLWRYHKPKGLVTTHYDPEGRPTVFDMLPPDLPRVISVGRLDFNTEGLLLLTNDGELARHLELPANGWLRTYRVRAFGQITQDDLDRLSDGIEVDGVRYGGITAALDDAQRDSDRDEQDEDRQPARPMGPRNLWLTIGLREGKNREVRNILGFLGLEVSRLIRVSYGPFQLHDLRPGHVDHIKRRSLSEQLGKDVAERFGLNADDAQNSQQKQPPQKMAQKPRVRSER
jgi:23S rRNA pseudouridine2605 synthase